MPFNLNLKFDEYYITCMQRSWNLDLSMVVEGYYISMW